MTQCNTAAEQQRCKQQEEKIAEVSIQREAGESAEDSCVQQNRVTKKKVPDELQEESQGSSKKPEVQQNFAHFLAAAAVCGFLEVN